MESGKRLKRSKGGGGVYTPLGFAEYAYSQSPFTKYAGKCIAVVSTSTYRYSS